MRQTPDRLREIASHLKDKMNLRSLIVTLAAIVVFTTTYMLILPAFTLDSQSAAEQGGIDVPAVETTAEDTSDSTDSAVADEKAAANDANANANQAEASGETKADQSAEKADAKAKEPNESAAKVKAADPEKSDVKLLTGKKTITARQGKGDDFAISAVVSTDAKVPADVTITATELGKNTDGFDYDQYKDDALAALKKDSSDVKSIKSIKFYDISLESDSQDKSVEPSAPVSVKISYEDGMKVSDADNIRIVHFAEQKNGSEKAQVLDANKNNVETTTAANGSKVTEASFDTDGFSKFAVVEVETIEKTVITADGKTYKVSVSYDKNAKIPEGSELEVKELTGDDYDAYLEKAASKLDKNAEDLGMAKFFDITIRNGDDEVKIASPVDVEIKLLDSDNLADSTQVLHFASEDKADVVDSKVDGDTVKFAADGFSVYAVVDDNTGDTARATVKFFGKNPNGDPVATYYVKNDDTLEEIKTIVPDPGIGGTLDSQQSFAGWYIGDTDDYTADTEPLTIEGVRDYLEKLDIKEGDVVNVYAMIFKHFNITYYGDDPNVSLGTHTIHARVSADSASYTVSMSYTPDSHQNFKGWKTTAADGGNNISGWEEGTVYANGTDITVSGDVIFNVEAPTGNWLVYHANGKGGTYNAPQFYLQNEKTSPAVNATQENMKRNGYTFKGWYTDEACTAGNEFTFGETIDDNVDIYAKWEPNETAPYTVILWGQNADRSAYEVLGSYVTNGRVGQNIPYTVVENGDEDYVTGVGANNGHYTGFSIKDADKNQQVKIKPEGDAVLNLHYDRIEYDLRFYLYWQNGNTYYYGNNSAAQGNTFGVVTTHTTNNANNLPSTTRPTYTSTVKSNNNVGDRYDNTERNYSATYFVLHAYYGQDISSMWPKYSELEGVGNNRPVSYVMMVGTSQKPRPSSGGDGTVKGLVSTLDNKILGATNDSDGNFLIVRFPNNSNDWRYHIWYETVEGEDYSGKTTHYYNGKTYYEDTVLEVRSSNTDINQQNAPQYTGYEDAFRRNQNWNGDNSWTTSGRTLNHINYVYNRLKYPIEYFDGNYVDGNGNVIQNRATHILHESGKIAHGAKIPDADKNYVPQLPAGEEGYVFEGWYLDEACTIPYPWNTMPVGGVKVYAKWRQIQYRVFLHPNADKDGQSDPTLSWGDESAPATEKQQMNFRISYGGKVSTPTGTRTGYEFVGWYRDPACTQVFSADAFELNETTVTADYDKTKDFTDVMDKWGKGATTNADTDRPWITKKFELYGKWRVILEGADGIKVEYDAGELGIASTAPTDDKLYLDEANSVAQAASSPKDAEKYQFLYWVVQKWDDTAGKYVDTGVEVYPGDSFTVKAENAKVEDLGSDKKSYTVRLRAEYGEKDVETPTHINWYANNGTGDTRSDNHLQINEAVNVRAANTFSYEGHRFLGWARMTEVSDQDGRVITIGNTSPENLKMDLDEDDLWLKWDPEHDNGAGKPKGAFIATALTGDGIAAGTVIDKVAADERLDYHGLVAVWEAEKYEVTIEKKVGEGTAADRARTFSIDYSSNVSGKYAGTFDLSDGQSSKIKEGTVTKVVPYGTVITVVEDEETFADFEKTYSAKLQVTAEGDNGSSTVTDGDTVNPETGTTNSFKITGDTKITVQNDRKAYEITFSKTDESGKALSGSTFELYVQNSSGTYVNALEENEKMSLGTVTKELRTGNYKLVEVGAPNGYIIANGEILFTIAGNGDVTITGNPTFTDGTTVVAAVSGKTITIKNEPGKPLPSTGGIGTTIFYILGSLLVVGCGIVLISRRRMGSDK